MRRPHILTASVALAVILGMAVAPSAQAAPSAGAEPDGAIAVQLLDVGGAPLPLAGVVASVYVPTGAGDGYQDITTDAAGRAVLSGLPASPWYSLRVVPPAAGAATYAPTQVDVVRVEAGATTSVAVPIAKGATVTGSLIRPDGSPLSGHEVRMHGWELMRSLTTTTDSAGRYTFVGLRSDIFEASTAALGEESRLTWATRVFAERPGSPPSRVSLSTRMVHTSYTVAVGVAVPNDAQSVVGATVILTDVATGAVSTQRTGGVAGITQITHFTVPSGRYTLQVRTVATPTTPSRTWWSTGANSPMTTDPAAAVPIRLDFTRMMGWYARIPRDG